MSRSKKTRYSSIFVVVLLLFAAAQNRTYAQDSSLQFEVLAYGERGQYPVGTHDSVIDGDGRLDITLWYPALNNNGIEEVIQYPYMTNPDSSMGMAPTVSGQAIQGAPYDLDGGPYPLVILSHGFSLGRTAYAWLAEHLASHGFVVVAPQHYELVDETLSEFWRASITRPLEMRMVLDYVEAEALAEGEFAGLIDAERIAVVGHSYGGYTALAMAGARIDINGMQALCAEAEQAGDPNAWLCGMVLPFTADMAELAGFDGMPEGLWPSWRDQRVDAVVSMAGDAYFFAEAGLAEIEIPVMALGGTADTGTPYAWGAQVAFEGAEHMIFGATCEALPFFAEIGFDAYCSDPIWDMEHAHDLANHFITAFLQTELMENPDARAVLSANDVSFAGITYDVQGY
jgi:predicted dienelactone hydrolase